MFISTFRGLAALALLLLCVLAGAQQTYWSTINAAYPASTLSPRIMLEKDRTDYPEFDVYTQLVPNSIWYVDWFHTPRFNATNSVASAAGTARLYEAWLCEVCPRNLNAIKAGTLASLSPTTVAFSGATKATAANWNTTTIHWHWSVGYTTVTGSSNYTRATFNASPCGRIALQVPPYITNGGLVDYSITANGSALPAANYSQPLTGAVHQVNEGIQTTSAAAAEIELANGLTPNTTYVVTLYLDPASASGSRLYFWHAVCTASLAYNSSGETGCWVATPSDKVGGNTNVKNSYYASAANGMQLASGTRVTDRYWATTDEGWWRDTVYDRNGNYVTSKTIDGHGAGAMTETEVAAGLPKGVYYVVQQGLPSKDAASSNYRCFLGGCYSYDETTHGTLGTDPPSRRPYTLIGVGNTEAEGSARWVGSSTGQLAYAGGTHGGEVQGTLDMVFCGNDITDAYNAAAAGTSWTGTGTLTASWTGCSLGFVLNGFTLTGTGGTATATSTTAGDINTLISSGDTMNVSGSNIAAFNGDQTVTVTSPTTFTFPTGASGRDTGNIYVTPRRNPWATFKLTQTWGPGNYSFTEPITLAQQCYVGSVYGGQLMLVAPSAPMGVPPLTGVDGGASCIFSDGNAPFPVTGRSGTSNRTLPAASSFAAASKGNQFLWALQNTSSPQVYSAEYDYTYGYSKTYNYLHYPVSSSGDLLNAGTSWTASATIRIVQNTSGLVLGGG